MDEHAPDPRQEALAELSAFVATQLGAGFDDESVLAQLEARGLTRETAQQLLQKVRGQGGAPAAAPSLRRRKVAVSRVRSSAAPWPPSWAVWSGAW